MAIKNRDGSIYSLQKPNHIMLEQQLWTRSERFILHNSFGKIIIWEISPTPTVNESLVEAEERAEEKEVKEKVKEEVTTAPPPNKKPAKTKIPTIKVLCLPAQMEEIVDPLYGEKYYSDISYGKKFMFDAVIESQNDINISLFTPSSLVTAGSVIYPQTNEKRWWRVHNVVLMDDRQIYNVRGTITDYHPDFSA